MNHTDDDLDLEVLRSIKSEVTADPEALARVRERVLTSPRPSRRRWVPLAVAGAAVVAIGVASALVLPHTSRPAPIVTTSSSQPGVAEFAAQAARATALSATKPSGTQWVKITLINEWTNYTNAVNDKVTNTDHPHTRTRITETIYVPSSNSKRWVRVMSSRDIPLSADAVKMCAHSSCSATIKPQRALHGEFPDPKFDTTDWQPPRTALAGLKADPTALMAKARSELPAQLRDSPSAQLGWFADKMGTTWIADAPLRAAMFTAIGTIDGIQLQPKTTINGQTGTALSAGCYQVIFDPNDYRLLGWRIIGGENTTQTLYLSEVVSSAP